MATVTDNTTLHRFELIEQGETAFLDYAYAKGQLVLVHAEVPQVLEGHGVGGTLVRSVLTEARTRGLQVVPQCSFVEEYIHRHPEFADLVAASSEQL
ncbi:GNAT family N-acetyltransferase [Granulicella sp. L60]|uniref:GNAT family N-acetyltransferase n=1 Tax=Granulicella sp. L60 TaxID=1641866 RepID=UPI00131C3872|nr:GNAT family N-acetyltransferase [Granulicella sp. L60]